MTFLSKLSINYTQYNFLILCNWIIFREFIEEILYDKLTWTNKFINIVKTEQYLWQYISIFRFLVTEPTLD